MFTVTHTHTRTHIFIQPPRSVSTSQIVPRPQARPTTPTTLSPTILSPTNGTMPSSPQSNDQELPAGWERRFAQNGRTFYIDHTTRRTQWVCNVYRNLLTHSLTVTHTHTHTHTAPSSSSFTKRVSSATINDSDLY